ncbi:hypothetical protein [Kitasatospora sp. NPDC085879]|jgi:hypothetical protein|uniref:hypothetical protein n=1 Tax=Kitasatospora sp. NPDC085879 TaxID=3154769 RepID=UPI0034499B0D
MTDHQLLTGDPEPRRIPIDEAGLRLLLLDAVFDPRPVRAAADRDTPAPDPEPEHARTIGNCRTALHYLD